MLVAFSEGMMPIFRSGRGNAPAWCELETFEIIELSPGSTYIFERSSPREKLIVGEGACRITYEGHTVDALEKTNLDLTQPNSRFEVVSVSEPTTLIRMCGHWGEVLGGSGLFGVGISEQPHDNGDPVTYPKQTDFDNHYHDCDEYWILYRGAGTAVSEGKTYTVNAGDCVATGMGHHHDFPQVSEPVKAVYFETTLEGRKRLGHLWDHTHGQAEPKQERV